MQAILFFAALAVSHLFPNPALAQSSRSPIDIQRDAAAALYGPRLASLGTMRVHVAANEHRYDVACKGKKTAIQLKSTPGIPLDTPVIGQGAVVSLGTLPRYPALPPKLEVKNETTPTCRILRDELKTSATVIAAELAIIDEDARRRGMLPGIMRDLKSTYGFFP